MIKAMKQPLIARQVIMAKQLPLTTFPIMDWQHAAHELAAIPTGVNPNKQHDIPRRNIIAPNSVTIITINSIIIKNFIFRIYIKNKLDNKFYLFNLFYNYLINYFFYYYY